MEKQEALDKVKIIEDYLVEFKSAGYDVVFNVTASLRYQIDQK